MITRTMQKRLKGLLTHGALVLGAAVFMLPILWMLGTSIKTPMETTQENLRFLPSAPRPSLVSPRMDATTFGETARLSGVSEEVWQSVEAELRAHVAARIEGWNPETSPETNDPPPQVGDRDVYTEAMMSGAMRHLELRVSDEARRITEVAEARAALLESADALLTDEVLRDILDRSYRRLAVGQVRVRTNDLLTTNLYLGEGWSVAEGPAELVSRRDANSAAEEVRYQFTRPGDGLRLRFESPTGLVADPELIDRVLVSHRADESWAGTRFYVERNGVRYSSEPGRPLFGRDWLEVELRFPGGEGTLLEQHNYLMLEESGAATGDAPLAIEMEVTSASLVGAWLSKMARAYSQAFRQVPFARYLATSFSLAIITILLAVFSATIVGYAFARLEWPGRDFFFVLLLATMMLPPQVTMIPQFIIMKELGWYNTLVPIWILSGFGIPFFVFLVRQFLKNVPRTLEDAARIDGCGFLRIYWHVMLPLIKPVILTITIFTFMATWNNFFAPLVYLNDERLFPVALGLFKFNLSVGQDVSLMMAGAFVASLPSIAIFALLQRYFVEGVTLTGTKE